MMTSQKKLMLAVLVIVFSSLFLSLCIGSTSIPVQQLFFAENGQINTIFLHLRLPRTAAAFITGGLLALAGSLMQLLLCNPLADPYVLGVSGGAALFTLLLMLGGASEVWLTGGAWLGSLSTIALMFLLARKHHWRTDTMLLCGIAIACGLSACISLILLISPDATLHNMLFWLTGDLNDARFPWLGLIVLSLSLFICLLLAPGLNMLGRGEMQARALGLPSQKYQLAIYLLSSLCTATAVTLAGCIGFVGLIIPHMTRMLAGYDHKKIIPIAILLGGSLLTVADTLARSLFAPVQLPVGILMAMMGVPIFIWILQK